MPSLQIPTSSSRNGLSKCVSTCRPNDPGGLLTAMQVTAVIAILAVSVLNLVSRTMGTNFSVITTSIKIGSLIFVFVLGIIFLVRHGPGPSLSGGSIFEGTSGQVGSYAIALYSGLWAFDGWDQCNVSGGVSQ